MKIVYVLAFVFLAIWLILTGVVGLAGIALSPALMGVMNVLALAAGVLLLVCVCKCYCGSDRCSGDLDKK